MEDYVCLVAIVYVCLIVFGIFYILMATIYMYIYIYMEDFIFNILMYTTYGLSWSLYTQMPYVWNVMEQLLTFTL